MNKSSEKTHESVSVSILKEGITCRMADESPKEEGPMMEPKPAVEMSMSEAIILRHY